MNRALSLLALAPLVLGSTSLSTALVSALCATGVLLVSAKAQTLGVKLLLGIGFISLFSFLLQALSYQLSSELAGLLPLWILLCFAANASLAGTPKRALLLVAASTGLGLLRELAGQGTLSVAQHAVWHMPWSGSLLMTLAPTALIFCALAMALRARLTREPPSV